MQHSTDFILMLIIILIIFFILILTILKFLPILEERKHIKMEIARSSGKERQYWERKLKNLYLKIFKM